jgi:Domain of unknown function (DUF222)
MPPDSFPGHGHDGEEPDGPRPLPGDGNELEGPGRVPEDDEDDEPGPEQGLFVCLPAEELTLAGFAQEGRADTMAPGPLLATVVHAITGEDGAGLSQLADDQLVGVLSGIRRLEARAAWGQLAVLAELARRRPPTGEPADTGQDGFSDFAADEVADELRLSVQSATGQIVYACAVANRLPRSFAALAAGRIHPLHLRIIEDETRILSSQHAARADEELAEAAESKTFGELRYAAHRLVLKLDPESAQRRKEAATQDAHVRPFREDSGNAGMIARELPCDEVLASWQHVQQRALDLRAAGLPGSLRELRVRAYLDLLQERDSRNAPGDPDPAGSPTASETRGRADQYDGPGGPPDGNNGRGPERSSGPARGPRHTGRPGTDRSGPARQAGPGSRDAGPSVAALVNITAPLSTLLGLSATPGEAAGFGLLDAPEARDLIAAAARHPDTRWCVTALHPDGTAAAHGCAAGRHPPPTGSGSSDDIPGPDPPPGTRSCDKTPGPDPPPGTRSRNFLSSLRIRMVPVARGHCDHARAEAGYRPSRTLQHLVKVRNARCTAPGCGRPAARCDLDHTLAWEQGGITCECDLAPLCRHHHRCKQAEGWWLEQPEPGVLRWRTPAGRRYTTTPTSYPV